MTKHIPIPVYYLFSVTAAVLIWQLLSVTVFPSIFFPPPTQVAETAVRLIENGTLPSHIQISLQRILLGFFIGSLIGFPVGLVLGANLLVRRLVEPFVHFFRFVPPIAWVSPAIIWLGIGEASKVALIIYTTTFMVLLNTLTGVVSIDRNKLLAARSLGASSLQCFFFVVFPATIPFIFTGMRLAMGNSFMTVVSAEMIAAQEGLGYMIIHARLFMALDQIFVGIICLGLLGWGTDTVLRFLIRRFGSRYQPVA
ncbi:ABC transporter permease [Billgrantia endophytica]|uniref:Nitrate ABC transporter permease n=1 Tax=Billgrantia endophytica TaxID=2033802 RepID=A0A2N7UAE6_9GAMM|nr:ABC transporter permease [Halomonas endophytica]PMR77413.1 nitrate ABC transporter permease [Halomonas endophytica]